MAEGSNNEVEEVLRKKQKFSTFMAIFLPFVFNLISAKKMKFTVTYCELKGMRGVIDIPL